MLHPQSQEGRRCMCLLLRKVAGYFLFPIFLILDPKISDCLVKVCKKILQRASQEQQFTYRDGAGHYDKRNGCKGIAEYRYIHFLLSKPVRIACILTGEIF
jgi:hypothetical protein